MAGKVTSSIGLLLLLAAAFLVPVARGAESRKLSAGEAEILVYILPGAHDMREQGSDAEAVLNTQTSDEKQFTFMLQAVVKNPSGSVLLGHFSVDRGTGRITNLSTNETVSSKEIDGVRRIMLR